MRFSTYDLTIDSELAMPELLPGRHTGVPDVHIRLGSVPVDGLPQGKQLGPFLWVAAETLWLEIPHIARFLISQGNEIIIDPEPGIDEDSVRVFLLGPVIGALLFQRGYLVLHGNAIRIGDQCMVCVGHSGVGKSTLAAGFMQRGYDILADDVVPVDELCRVLPGFPRIKLWQDVADKLAINTTDLTPLRPNTLRFNYPLGPRFSDQALPIRWVYIIGTDKLDAIESKSIEGMGRFLPLRNNTYRLSFLNGLGLKAEHLKRCGQLAGKIHLARVIRPQFEFSLDALIDHLLADIAANP
jgi:hypothetical protein